MLLITNKAYAKVIRNGIKAADRLEEASEKMAEAAKLLKEAAKLARGK